MREIIVDTETTGLSAERGDRIIEIGCIEVVNRRLTGRSWHRHFNPKRAIDRAAFAVHGLSEQFLQDKPEFGECAQELCSFISGARLVIHNAPFDVGFLNAELTRIGYPQVDQHCLEVLDSLILARKLFPGKRNSLDALCDRFEVRRDQRTLHGALLDAQLLTQVYLAMTRSQSSFLSESSGQDEKQRVFAIRSDLNLLKIQRASTQEEVEHQTFLDELARNLEKNFKVIALE